MCEVVLVSGSDWERGEREREGKRKGKKEKRKVLVCVRHSESVGP